VAERRAADGRGPAWAEWVRWAALALAVGVLLIFVVAQRQSIDVSYGRSPSASTKIEPPAGNPDDVTVPSVEEMTALVAADDVVRLPGSIASWDEQRVRTAAGATPVRILVAPPGLDEAERKRLRGVENATITIAGTRVSGGMYVSTGSTLPDWRAEFAAGDVTNLLLGLIAGLRDQPAPADIDPLTRREPAAAELQPVVADLRRAGVHIGRGATLTGVPEQVSTAFPDRRALVVALPQQPTGKPLPRYGPALAAQFPDTPIVVMYGSWIEYDGPDAAEFADLATATFYGRYGDVLSRSGYPQRNVLGVYLNRVIDLRYAGLFDRPLPYRPVDPLRVALPALPWLFTACVAAFLVLSVRSARRPAAPEPIGTPARLAALTGLAVEMSVLTQRASEPALTRGITKLMAARDALGEDLPDEHVRELLGDAEAELDEAASLLPFPGYRPAERLGEQA
jgi:hypothetical protein